MLLRIFCCYFSTHIIAATKAMQSVHPNETVADLAVLAVDNYVRWPRISYVAMKGCHYGVHL